MVGDEELKLVHLMSVGSDEGFSVDAGQLGLRQIPLSLFQSALDIAKTSSWRDKAEDYHGQIPLSAW